MTGKSGFKMRSGSSPLERLWPFGKKKVKTSGAVLVKPGEKEESAELIAWKAEQRDNRNANKKSNSTELPPNTKKKNWKVQVKGTTIGNASNTDLDDSTDLEKANKRMS